MSQDNHWILNASVLELQRAMEQGRLCSVELVMFYLKRIAKCNVVNAVLELNPDALHIAEAMDVERLHQGPRGPLHGIPVLLKDNIDTADKLHTSAGSLALENHYAREDSFVAKQLRRVGAVILGKSNMTEWANFMTQDMPNGYSSRGGQVKNPYGDFDVGGSSSGSAAAVAAGLATVAVGTETSGSILSPASSCSVVGIKPTVGLISRSGIIPIAHSQDTAGPMARTVLNAAVLLGALTGIDHRDAATMMSEGRRPNDYVPCLQANGLQGARLGIARECFGGLDPERMQVMERAIAVLSSLGAEVIDPVDVPAAREKFDSTVLIYEFKPNLNAYLKDVSPHIPVHSLKDLIDFNHNAPEKMLRFGQTILLDSEGKSGALTEAEYILTRASDIALTREQGIDYTLEENNLDALVTCGNFGCGIAARAGYPSVTVPAGYTDEGRPVGITLTASAFSEPTLLKLAYAFEQGTLLRRDPVLR